MLSAQVPGADGRSVNADVAANVMAAVAQALHEKLPTLRQLTSLFGRGLALRQSYIFADPENVRHALEAQHLDRSSVDVVFFVDSEDRAHLVAHPGRRFTPETGGEVNTDRSTVTGVKKSGSTYLQAAIAVLGESERPLTSREILEKAISQSLLIPFSKTPLKSLQSVRSRR